MSESIAASEFPAEKITLAFRQARMITLSMAATLPAYAIVVEILRHSQPVASIGGTGVLRITCFVLAGVFIFTATVVKGTLLRTAPPDPAMRLARLRVASIVTAALSEGPAVLGLMLFIVSRSRSDFYILLVVAAYLLVRHLPLQAAWEVFVRRGGDAR